MKAQLFGLDYDDTYTADPDLWRQFISDAQRRGHKVVCVTARRKPPDFTCDPRLPESVPIVCSGPEYKKHAAARAGYPVTIWIDDTPELIAPSLILEFGP